MRPLDDMAWEKILSSSKVPLPPGRGLVRPSGEFVMDTTPPSSSTVAEDGRGLVCPPCEFAREITVPSSSRVPLPPGRGLVRPHDQRTDPFSSPVSLQTGTGLVRPGERTPPSSSPAAQLPGRRLVRPPAASPLLSSLLTREKTVSSSPRVSNLPVRGLVGRSHPLIRKRTVPSSLPASLPPGGGLDHPYAERTAPSSSPASLPPGTRLVRICLARPRSSVLQNT